jgi:hypothetical protein
MLGVGLIKSLDDELYNLVAYALPSYMAKPRESAHGSV